LLAADDYDGSVFLFDSELRPIGTSISPLSRSATSWSVVAWTPQSDAVVMSSIDPYLATDAKNVVVRRDGSIWPLPLKATQVLDVLPIP
jgi:hypothetical protein